MANTTGVAPSSTFKEPYFATIREAINKVPEVKWALGVAGVLSAVGLILSGLQIHPLVALIGFPIMIVFMALLAIFAASIKDIKRTGVSRAFVWFVLIIFITFIAALFSAALINSPYHLRDKVEELIATKPITIDFGSAGTIMLPYQQPANQLFHKFGIEVSDATPNTQVIVQGGTFVRPDGSHFMRNVLTQTCQHGEPVQFTLRFKPSISSLKVVRAGLLSRSPSGVVHPKWQACVYDGKEEIQCKGEPLLASYADAPEQEIDLEGTHITSAQFVSDGRKQDGTPFASTCAVLIDRITIKR